MLAVGGKGKGITQGFPQELWINTVSYRPGADTASSAEVCFFRDSIDNKTLHIGPEVSNFTSAN